MPPDQHTPAAPRRDSSVQTTLSMDFIEQRYAVGEPLLEIAFDELASFSRSSPAGHWIDGIYQAVPEHQPRWSRQGLLIESGGNNLLEKWNNPGAWGNGSLSGTLNAAHGVDGRCSAFVSALDDRIGQENVTVPADRATYTLSVYVRPLRANSGRVYLPECGLYPRAANAAEEAWFDFATRSFGAGMRGPWIAEPMQGGWTRLSVPQVNDGHMTIYALRLRNDPAHQIVYGGIQLERSPRPTSLMSASGVHRWRIADSLRVARGLWSSLAGTLQVDADPGVVVDLQNGELVVSGSGWLRRVTYVHPMGSSIPIQLMAMNIAGAEFGTTMPGQHLHHYTWPVAANFTRYREFGVNLVRLPFRWERIQHTLHGELDEAEMQRLIGALDGARGAGMRVLLDMHNYHQRYINGVPHFIGVGEVSDSAWTDSWVRLVRRVMGHPAVWGYGLMNEPMGVGGNWAQSAQRCIDAIRALDADTPIIVAGDRFSTAQFWVEVNRDFPLRGNHLIYEAHLYLDRDTSGNYADREEDIHPDIGVYRTVPFFNWLRRQGLTGFLGELGVPYDMPKAMIAMERVIAYAVANHVPVFYWAGGSQWTPGHDTACEYNGVLLPQVDVLARHRQLVDRIGPVGDEDERPPVTFTEPSEPSADEP
jgi:hypothetical protein